jgi:hypothetical protein
LIADGKYAVKGFLGRGPPCSRLRLGTRESIAAGLTYELRLRRIGCRYPPYDEAGVYAVERAGLANFLDYRPEFSEFVLPRLLEDHQRYDFIYIDGSHLFENVFIDAFYAARLLNDGGWIAMDDSSEPHVAKVNDFIRTNFSGAVREVSLGGMSTVASLLGKRQLTVFERLLYDGPHPPRKWDTPLRLWDSKLGRF